MKDKRFYNFNFKKDRVELYLYGQIVSGKNGGGNKTITFQDFKNTLDQIDDNATLDMYINCVGGDVFTTQSMVAMLRRLKNRGITINCLVDGLSASCASWLMCIADNIYIYPQSVVMIHKPASDISGNADEMLKEIEVLNKFEDDVIIPLYMSKAKEGISVEFFKEKMAKETWFSANEILDVFQVELIEEEKSIRCCVNNDIMNRFTNIPDNIKELINKEGTVMEDNKEIVQDIDNAEVKQDTVEEIVEAVEEVSEEVDTNEEVQEEVQENVEAVEEISNDVQSEEATEEEEVQAEVQEEVEVQEEAETVESDEAVEVVEQINNDAQLEEVASLKNQLNEATQKIISLNETIENMLPIVEAHKARVAEEERIERENLIAEKKNYYAEKFEKLGHKEKFNSDEVQGLINNCIEDKDAELKLNSMLVNMIEIKPEKAEKVAKRNIVESVSKIFNLIETEDSITEKYGF